MPIIEDPLGYQPGESITAEELQAKVYEYWEETGLFPGQIPPPPSPPPIHPPPEGVPPPPITYPPAAPPTVPPISGQITGVGEASNIWTWVLVGLIIYFLTRKKNKKGK